MNRISEHFIHQVKSLPYAGEERCLMYRQDGDLAIYPAMYMMKRREQISANSQKAINTEIKRLELWAELRDIDFQHAMVYGECLSPAQVYDLADHFSIEMADLKKLVDSRALDKNKMYNSFTRLEPVTVNKGLSLVSDYLLFLGQYGNSILGRRSDPATQALLDRRAKRLRKPTGSSERGKKTYHPGSIAAELSENRPKAVISRLNGSSDRTLKEFVLWYSLCDPHKIWPKNEARAIRNHLIICLFLATGMRGGELMQLKFEDVVRRLTSFDVKNRRHDPDDPRKLQPQAKTLDRRLKVSDVVWDVYERWSEHHADISWRCGEESPFIIINVARDPKFYGRPMTTKGVDNVIKEAFEFAELPPLSKHKLRHARVQDLAQLAVEKGWTDEEWRKAATYLFGWSDTSSMPSHYSGDRYDLAAEKSMMQIWDEARAKSDNLDEEYIKSI